MNAHATTNLRRRPAGELRKEIRVRRRAATTQLQGRNTIASHSAPERRLAGWRCACSLGALADTTIYGKISLSLEHVAMLARRQWSGHPAHAAGVTSKFVPSGLQAGEEDLGDGNESGSASIWRTWRSSRDINPDNQVPGSVAAAFQPQFLNIWIWKGSWGLGDCRAPDIKQLTSHIAGHGTSSVDIINAGLAGLICRRLAPLAALAMPHAAGQPPRHRRAGWAAAGECAALRHPNLDG